MTKVTPKMGQTKTLKLVIVLLLCFLLAPGLTLVTRGAGLPSPTSDFYINDFANILDSETERYIANAAATLENKTTAQLVVVTMTNIGDQTFEHYTIDLFRKWGIGSKDKNNGVMIFLDLEGRRSRIEVGYGLEGALSDGKTGRIQNDYMVPYFEKNDFDEGIRQGFNALLVEIYKEYNIDIDSISGFETPVKGEEEHTIPTPVVIAGIILLVILISIDFKFTGGIFTLTILRILFRGGRGGGGGGRIRGGGGSGGGGGSSRGW